MKNKKDDVRFVLVMLLVPGGFGMYKVLNGADAYWGLIGIGMLPFALYFIAPPLLTRLRIGWEWLGHQLGVINSIILLTIIYLFVITPLGLLLRAARLFKGNNKDALHTYWQLPAAETSSIKKQF